MIFIELDFDMSYCRPPGGRQFSFYFSYLFPEPLDMMVRAVFGGSKRGLMGEAFGRQM